MIKNLPGDTIFYYFQYHTIYKRPFRRRTKNNIINDSIILLEKFDKAYRWRINYDQLENKST